MADWRTEQYAQGLSRLIQAETISAKKQTDRAKFYRFHDLLRQEFPKLFAICEFEDFNGSILLRWKGASPGSTRRFSVIRNCLIFLPGRIARGKGSFPA